MSKITVILFLFVIFEIGTANVLIMVVKSAGSAIQLSNKLWKRFHNQKEIGLSELNNSLTKIQKSLKNVELTIGNIESDVSKLMSVIEKNTKIELKLHQLEELVHEINTAAIILNKYMKVNISNPLLEQFATWSISQSPASITGILEKINMIAMPNHERGLISTDLIGSIMEMTESSNHYMCTMQQSTSQLFFNMYSTLLMAEIKGYTIMQFSWMILEIIRKENYEEIAKLEKKQFQTRMKNIIQASKLTMNKTSRDMWRCDPKQHEKGSTYLALTRLLQGYIENEIEMSLSASCNKNCAGYQNAQSYGHYKSRFSLKQQNCKGKILDCRFIESDMTVCQSDRNADRRYEWIEYKKGTKFGEKKECDNKNNKILTTVNSWWHFFHCSYCMCICDDPSPLSDRYFSLKSELSNVKKNRIIVGIRFVKLKQVIYIQICEGALLAGGKINKNSIAWKKIRPMDLKYAKKYLDYYQMSYKERTIDLHDLEGPSGYVLTGVRFVISESHLNLKIQTMPFNIKTGKLQTNKYKWISNNNHPNTKMNPREELKLTEPDIPTKFSKQSLPDSIDNQYMLFTHTDFEKDAAQTTVPYLDAQPVIPKIPAPLSGIGIFHKGFQGSGGFIALKIFTYNYEHHL